MDIFIPIPHLLTTNIGKVVIQSELTRSFWDHYVRSLRERLRFVITILEFLPFICGHVSSSLADWLTGVGYWYLSIRNYLGT